MNSALLSLLLRPLHLGLMLLWLASIPVLCLVYLGIEPSPDQSQFDYMGWMATQGLPFYAGSFDMNWPGGMILHELAVRLFGPQPWAWRLFDFVIMQGITATAALFLARAGFALAPLIVLVLYPPIYITAGPWMAGERDIIAVGLLIAACTCMLAPHRHELLAMALAGALVAGAVLIRPTYLSVLVGLGLLEAIPRTWAGQSRRHGLAARLLALAVGFGAIILAAILGGIFVGSLDDFYQQSFLFTGSVYYGDPPLDMVETLRTLFVVSYHWTTLCGAVGLGFWLVRDRWLSYPLMLVLGLGTAIALSYAVQRKGFGYHLGGVLPLLVMLTAVAIDQARARAVSSSSQLKWTYRAAAIALTGLVSVGTAAELEDYAGTLVNLDDGLPQVGLFGISAAEQAQLLTIIGDGSAPEDRMVQYGTAYQIPYLAERLPAYRFITPAVEMMTPDFRLYPEWMAEVEEGLREHRPRFVLIAGAPFVRDAKGLHPVEGQPPILGAILEHVASGYEVAMEGSFGTLFERVAE